MSQAALNVRPRNGAVKEKGPRQTYGAQAGGVVFLLLVIAAMFWCGWNVYAWMQDPHRMPLSRLVITGERHYTQDDDVRQMILALGEPGTFVTQDVNVIRQQIMRLPWVKQVSVRKQWPDVLKIHLVEYVPFARWNAGQLIDREGNIFSVPTSRLGSQPLPQLSGPDESVKAVLEGYQKMAQLLADHHLTLQQAVMTARHAWRLTLNDGVRVELGRQASMARLQRFIKLWPILSQQAQKEGKRIDYLDVRYDSGAAVGWTPVTDRTVSQQ